MSGLEEGSWPDYAVAAGHYPGFTEVDKFGEASSIAQDDTEEIWDGNLPYTYPTTALMTKLSQTVDQAAMRGKTIEAQGLGADWDLVTQEKALDASLTTTAVTWDTPMLRCFRLKVLANVVGDSPIRCHDDGETTDYAIILPGNNRTLMAVYTVPRNKTLYVARYWGAMVDTTGSPPSATRFRLWEAQRGKGYEFWLKHSKSQAAGAASIEHPFRPFWPVPEKTDVRITATPSGGAVYAQGGFEGFTVDYGASGRY